MQRESGVRPAEGRAVESGPAAAEPDGGLAEVHRSCKRG